MTEGSAPKRWTLQVHSDGNLCCTNFTGRPVCYWCVNAPSNTTTTPVVPESALRELEALHDQEADLWADRLAKAERKLAEAEALIEKYRAALDGFERKEK